MYGEDRGEEFWTENSNEMRCTFAAAALSAAIRRDLSARFQEDWRFPIDDDMFAAFYEYLLTAMDDPYSF